MATGAVTAGVVGGAMAIGGTAAAIRAMRMNTKARGRQYGGSEEALNATREGYQQGIESGQGQINNGMGVLGQGVGQAQGVGAVGRDMVDAGQNQATVGQGQQGYGAMTLRSAGGLMEQAARGNAPSQAQMMMQANADQAQRSAMGMASSARGGNQAAAMRNATNAGNQMQLQAGQQAGAMRAAEMAQARGDYANLGASAYGLGNQQVGLGAGMMGQGMQGMQYGANATMGAGQFEAGMGAQRESTYLGAQQNVEQAQLGADMDYERRRQEEAQRKSQNLWNFGSKLINGGASMLAGAGGAGGGG